MRRRSAVLSALAAGLLLAAVAAPPALADDAPTPAPTDTATATPAADPSPTDPAPTDPTSTAPPDPVDLTVSPGGSTGDPIATPRGSDASFGMLVHGTAPAATLSLTLPATLTFEKAFENASTPLTCTPAAATVTCDLGALADLASVVVEAKVAPTTPIGTVHLTATVTPVPGPDANPDDNTIVLSAEVVGHAVVTQTQSVKQIDVPLGGSAPFTITLSNAGPDAATNAKVRFVVQSNDSPAPVLNGFAGDAPDHVAQVNGAFEWTPGTIAVGASVSLTITVTATSPAIDSALSFSSSYDGVGEICVNAACLSGAPIRTYVPGESVPGAPILANTGSADGTYALVALGLLVSGGALVAAGRRRRLG